MDLSFKKSNNILIIELEGELDLHTVKYFKKNVDEVITQKIKNVVLNLNEIKFIDSSGLGAILGIYKRLTAQLGELSISNVTPQVERIFELSGVLKIIKLYPTEEDALENIVRRQGIGE